MNCFILQKIVGTAYVYHLRLARYNLFYGRQTNLFTPYSIPLRAIKRRRRCCAGQNVSPNVLLSAKLEDSSNNSVFFKVFCKAQLYILMEREKHTNFEEISKINALTFDTMKSVGVASYIYI